MEPPEKKKLRLDQEEMHGLTLTREVEALPGGKLQQDLTIRVRGRICSSTRWIVAPKGSHDNPLDALDAHWPKLAKEFKRIVQQATDYHYAKGGDDDNFSNGLGSCMSYVASLLLKQPMTDKKLISGKIGQKDYPLVEYGEVMYALRETAENPRLPYKLDRFEKLLQKLDKNMIKMRERYDKAAYDIAEDGLQATAEDDSGEDWRGDQHPVHTGSYKQELPWQDEDYDVDDVRDKKSDSLLRRFDRNVARFANQANRLWMEAVTDIYEKRDVKPRPDRLEHMRQRYKNANALYEELKALIQDTGVGAYEMRPFFATMENELLPHMQKILSALDRPKILQDDIIKCLPKKRGYDS
ncbi:MAG: hypothetical protein EBV03_06860 [Proteobacteria bacterium]|nr:hypothetical protein [Pseudomonadota bacterium]